VKNGAHLVCGLPTGSCGHSSLLRTPSRPCTRSQAQSFTASHSERPRGSVDVFNPTRTVEELQPSLVALHRSMSFDARRASVNRHASR
jgi:hypothetical protein